MLHDILPKGEKIFRNITGRIYVVNTSNSFDHLSKSQVPKM